MMGIKYEQSPVGLGLSEIVHILAALFKTIASDNTNMVQLQYAFNCSGAYCGFSMHHKTTINFRLLATAKTVPLCCQLRKCVG